VLLDFLIRHFSAGAAPWTIEASAIAPVRARPAAAKEAVLFCKKTKKRLSVADGTLFALLDCLPVAMSKSFLFLFFK
jgi:hypothetical protein